jgi:hypothetical protein
MGTARSVDDGDLWFVEGKFDVPAGRLQGSGWAIVVARSPREARLMAQTALRGTWERETGEWVDFDRDSFSFSRIERLDDRRVRPIAAHVERRSPPDAIDRSDADRPGPR